MTMKHPQVALACKEDIQDDYCICNQSGYKKMYDWLYYIQVAHGYMCKICEVFYGKSTVTTGRGRDAWSHNAVMFHGNAGKSTRPCKIKTSHWCYSGNNFHQNW